MEELGQIGGMAGDLDLDDIGEEDEEIYVEEENDDDDWRKHLVACVLNECYNWCSVNFMWCSCYIFNFQIFKSNPSNQNNESFFHF